MAIAKLIGLLSVIALGDGRRTQTWKRLSKQLDGTDDIHIGGDSQKNEVKPSGPCWEGKKVKPALGCSHPLLSENNKRWCDCEAQKKAEMARDNARFDARGLDVWNSRLPNGTVVNTFEQGAKERALALKKRKEEEGLEWQIAKDTASELASLALNTLKAKFVGVFNKMVTAAQSAKQAVRKAIFMLLSVPALTQAQYKVAKKALEKKYANMEEQWPAIKEMLLNLVANGHLGGPGVGRARVTEERRAYLKTLRTLPSIDPGPQYQVTAYVPPEQTRENTCVGYARLCGPDNGGMDCCARSGTCTRMRHWEDQTTIPMHVCM